MSLYETLIARCTKKAEEIDDSDGSMGMFASDLHAGWIKARQAGDADRAETARLLLAWIDADEYGFTNDLETEAPKVLDKAGLAAFEQAVLARLEAERLRRKRDRNLDYDCSRWERALRAVYEARRDVRKYVDLCERTSLSKDDCAAIATMLQSKRKLEQALGWVERGMGIGEQGNWVVWEGHRLPGMRRELLAKLGRGAEALDAAWDEFQKGPSLLAYNELLRYTSKDERPAWREKALAASENGHLHAIVEMWLALDEIERLASRLERTSDLELERQSHYTTEPAAERLAKAHPAVAARIYRALCVRILDAGKSRYYHEALTSIGKAVLCYRKAGLTRISHQGGSKKPLHLA